MYKFGAIQSPADHRDFLYRAIFAAETLPRKYSRRLEMGPVRNQGAFGTCVGFAASGVKDNHERREFGGNIQTSPLFVYKKCKEMDGIPNQEGTYPRVAMKALTDFGVCLESFFPYSQMKWPTMPAIPADAERLAANYKIGAYASIGTVDEVRQAIVKSGPVLGAILVCENFVNVGSNGIINLPAGKALGGHAICVVGYDDDMKANGHTGYFEVRNSWGDTWGEGGYCWIPYDFFNLRLDTGMPCWFESWSSVDIILPPKQAQKVSIWIDRNTALVDGVEKTIDQPPTIDARTGRTLVPIRFIAETLGFKVEWNDRERRIDISRQGV